MSSETEPQAEHRVAARNSIQQPESLGRTLQARHARQGRHSRRIEKLANLERQLFGNDAEAVLKNLQIGDLTNS